MPGASPARLHRTPRCPAQPRPCLAKRRRRQARAGWESPARRVIPMSPPSPALLQPAPPGAQETACTDSPAAPSPRPGAPACPRLFPESSLWARRRRRRRRPETFPPASLSFPGLLCGTLPSPPAPATEPAADSRRTRSGARAARVTCQESFQLSAWFPPRGPGLGARRAGRSAACGSCGSQAGLPQLPPRRQRSGPSPRLARPTPGPHWQRESPPLRVFRKAPSLCAPAGAAPPAPLPTGAAPALGPAGVPHANFPPGAFAPPHPARPLREAELPR